jgi:hypothetical protein
MSTSDRYNPFATIDPDRLGTETAIAVETMRCAPWLFADEAPEKARLTKAHKLVLQGRIWAIAPGCWEVQGSQKVYRINGPCPCPQAEKGKTQFCYHRVAVELYERVCQRLHVSPTPPRQTVPPVSEESPMEEPEVLPATSLPETQALTTPLAAAVLEQSLAEWSKQRAVITRYIQQHFIEGIDYYSIKVGSRETKATLGKSGSEKFLGLFMLQASFSKDADTWEMLGSPAGLLCYRCTLHTRSGEVVGEGRGARDIKKDGGDVNKAIKMATKSAQVDAILRTGALSDAFTQDLEEERESRPARETKPAQPGHTARQQIWRLLQDLGHGDVTRQEVGRVVQELTGYELEPDNYPAIIAELQAATSAA